MKCRSSKPTSFRNTAVRQQTRTVKVPTVLPWGRSKVNLNPHDFLSSSSHGSLPLPSTSAGWTTRIVSPVMNRPTTGCNRQVFSRGLTIPNYQMSRTPLLFDALLFCGHMGEKTRSGKDTIIPNALDEKSRYGAYRDV